MKEIELSGGFVALVDDDDFEWLSRRLWQVHTKRLAEGRSRYCAIRTDRSDGGKRTVYMHREIMGARGRTQVDHINGDALDNRKENLRLASNQQNQRNVRKKSRRHSTSAYKGVGWHGQSGCWRARISLGSRRVVLGGFTTEEEAAIAYDEAAREHFGEFAVLNFPHISAAEERRAEERVARAILRLLRSAA